MFLILAYKTNDPTLIDSKINAVGTIYDPEGNEIAKISYPNGFTIQDKGFIMFSKGLNEQISSARINVHLTDLDKEEQLSNELEINVTATDPIVSF